VVSNNSSSFKITGYSSDNPKLWGGETSFTSQSYNVWFGFAFSGHVNVTIVSTVAFASARILPTPMGVLTTTHTGSNGQTTNVTFTLTQPGQYVLDTCPTGSPCVEGNVNLTAPIFIFADDISALIPAPNPSDPSVYAPAPGAVQNFSLSGGQTIVYFGPGRYVLYNHSFTLDTNQMAYLAAGSYVIGTINATKTASNFSLVGQGVLSGEYAQLCASQSNSAFCKPMFSSGQNNNCGFLLQGITFVNSPTQNTEFSCPNTAALSTVSNTKMISWHATTAAIRIGANVLIETSFFKIGDDSLHLFASNTILANCVMWEGKNWGLLTQFGGNTNVSIANNYVVRTEWTNTGGTANNLHDAVFSSYGGLSTPTSNINVTNLYVENSSTQLLKLMIQPGGGSTNGLMSSWTQSYWTNITVVDPQAFSSLVISYNPLYVIDIAFNNVVIAGQVMDIQLNAAPTYYINRVASLEGNLAYQPFLRSVTSPTQFMVMDTNTLSIVTKSQLTTNYVYVGLGEFHNDGYSSAVFLNTQTSQLGVWSHPFQSGVYTTLASFTIPSGYVVQALDDFNGDAVSDVLLWSASTQEALVLLLAEGGTSVFDSWTILPMTGALTWAVTGTGDMDANGCADIVLSNVNVDTHASTVHLEVVFLAPSGFLAAVDLPTSALPYSPPNSGVFDSTWKVVAVDDFTGNVYGCLLWWSASTSSLAIQQFNGSPPTQGYAAMTGVVATTLSDGEELSGVGDCNSDGSADLIIYDAFTGNYTILVTGAWPNHIGVTNDPSTQFAVLPAFPFQTQWWASSQPTPSNFSSSFVTYIPGSSQSDTPQPIVNLAKLQTADTAFLLSWDADNSSVQYHISVPAVGGYTQAGTTFALSGLTNCSIYNASVSGINATGYIGPPTPVPTLYTTCANLSQLFPVIDLEVDGVYSIALTGSNNTLCLGSLSYNANFYTPQLVPCKAFAENLQFQLSGEYQLLAVNSPGNALKAAPNCDLGNNIKVSTTNNAGQSLWGFNFTSQQLNPCNNYDSCMEATTPELGSNVTIEMCMPDTPTQQWQLLVSSYGPLTTYVSSSSSSSSTGASSSSYGPLTTYVSSSSSSSSTGASSSSSSHLSPVYPGQIAGLAARAQTDTTYVLSWNNDAGSSQYHAIVSGGLGAIQTTSQHVTFVDVPTCASFSAVVFGSSGGMEGENSTTLVFNTTCPSGTVNVTTNLINGGTYNLMPVGNTSLSIGVAPVNGTYVTTQATPMQLLINEAWAQYQQFVINTTASVMLAPDAAGMGLATPSPCGNAQPVELRNIPSNGPTTYEQFVYNNATLQLANCGGSHCVQANSLSVGSAIITTACNSSNPLQQWLLGVSMGV
jgi:hypothetical protein